MTTTLSRARPEVTDEAARTGRLDTVRAALADAAAEAGALAIDATARLPSAAATTRAAYDGAARRIRGSSDEMLRLGTAVSFGFALGLLIAGASRILVAASLVPVGMMGLTMLERWSGSSQHFGRPETPNP
jgi:hypothetical protein